LFFKRIYPTDEVGTSLLGTMSSVYSEDEHIRPEDEHNRHARQNMEEDSSYFDALLNSPIQHLMGDDDDLDQPEESHFDPLENRMSSTPFHLNDARAVHMEVQENAKIPHAYHIPVRRSSSTGVRSIYDREDDLINEIIRLNEADVTLTEHFLGSDMRSSKSAAYSSAGALMSSIGTMVAGITKDVHDALDAVTEDTAHMTNNPSSTLYARREPLPIPQNINPSFLAKDGPKIPSSKPSISYPPPHSRPSGGTGETNVTSLMIKKSTNTMNQISSKAVLPNNTVPSSLSLAKEKTKASISQAATIAKPHPINAISSNISTPSIIEATNKRSQFGFGDNHSVPSVPQPPTALHLQFQKPSSTLKPSNVTKLPQTVIKSTNTEGVSYERKKQRAKDARVKLNESIERLELSINLAGSQAKERLNLEKCWTMDCDKAAEYSKATISMTDEVIKTAEAAKKWNRPSFVGSAATIIQQLNAECEALMRELVELKKERMSSKEIYTRTVNMSSHYLEDNNLAKDTNRDKLTMLNVEKRKHGEEIYGSNRVSDSGSFDDIDQCGPIPSTFIENSPGKRQRTEVESVLGVDTIWQDEKICIAVGSFLDPRSIMRAVSTSRYWKSRLSCLKQDVIWTNLCYQRFGAYNVRERKDALGENDVTPSKKEGPNDNMLCLYRHMNDAIVRPRCLHQGNIFLGRGEIRNSICAWVSAVERSNGETRRSVLSFDKDNSKYISLPVVELRVLIQNVGVSENLIRVPDQIFSVDASTKRKRDEMLEITSDDRLKKKVLNVEGIAQAPLPPSPTGTRNLAELRLFESKVIVLFIHAVGCPTTSKFTTKAKYLKILVNIKGTTVPLVIPIMPIAPKS
jgi:hypothetical protein